MHEYLASRLYILKAKRPRGGMPAGTRRKWKDGTYIKGGDHKWHREKADRLTFEQLKADKKEHNQALVSDMTEAVHKLIAHLHDLDIHPEDAKKKDLTAFWAEFFDDVDWDEDNSYVRFSEKALGIVQRFHGAMLEAEKSKSKESPALIAADPAPVPKIEAPVAPAELPAEPEPKKGEFKASPYQQDIYDFIAKGQGSAIIDAKAGAGKTTTIVNALKFISPQKQVVFMAFNKSIATELSSRVPSHVAALTLNAMGHRAWGKFAGYLKVDANKNRAILREMVDQGLYPRELYSRIGDDVKKLMDCAKIIGIAPAGMGLKGLAEDTVHVWSEMMDHFGITFDDPEDEGVALEWARAALKRSVQLKTVIDFNDQLYMPIIYGASFPKYDFVFIDEAQDVSDIKREMAFKCLKNGGRLIAVGDPNQAIYGFAGANPQSLELIREQSKGKKLPLSISYRCPKAVIDLAKTIVPDIEAAPTAIEGSVTDLGMNFDPKDFRHDDMIICRTNKPLVAMAYKLLRAKIPCKIKGRDDIGAGLVGLIDKMKAKDVGSLIEKLQKWQDKQIERLRKRDPDASVEHITDKVETLMVFIENNTDDRVQTIKEDILSMFSDDTRGYLTLSSVHKAKGLEAPRVFILNKHLMPSKMAKKHWEKVQEANLQYVAYTRAQKDLVFIATEEPGIQKSEDTPEPLQEGKPGEQKDLLPDSKGDQDTIEKAKKAPVGTVRSRKAGKFIKDKPGHWAMLREIVREQHRKDGVHPNHPHAKLMHSAAKKLVRHLASKRGAYNPTVAHKFLEAEFGHLEWQRFGKWRRRVLEAVEKYMKELQAVYDGEATRNPSEALQSVKAWQHELSAATSGMKSDAERDAWIAGQFARRKKPIEHILYACRELIGHTPLSMVPDEGFRGFCKAIIQKVYEHGPSSLSADTLKTWNKAFSTFMNPEGAEDAESVVPLARALAHADSKALYRQHPKWFVYCATRMALKNDGMVNLKGLERYMVNAMKFHGTKNPPAPDYDEPGALRSFARLGLLTPEKAVRRIKRGRKLNRAAGAKMRRTFMKLKRRRG